MSALIPVRQGEELHLPGLVEWLAGLPGMPAGVPEVTQFSAGRANLTYLLTFPGGEELVLRRPPLGPLPPGSHDMDREHRVLSRLWRCFDKAPKAVALCLDESVIGAPFFLMERKGGVVVTGRVPEVFGGGLDPAANRRLSEVVIDTLVELHAVDPNRCGLGDLGNPEGFLRRQVDGWRGRWDAARHQPLPLADELGEWLSANLPASPPPTLVHNDWRLDNMAVDETDPGRCVAVFDWDMATRGDPLADLGTLMATWIDPGEEDTAVGLMPTTSSGWIGRRKAVSRYAERSGRDLTAIDWYLVFGAWKLGVVLQQIFIRWHRGQTDDPRFADMADRAGRLFALAARRRP